MSTVMWTEKYRPESLKDIINQQDIVSRLQGFVKNQNLPHLLFAGPPGTGKTTAALSLIRDLYQEFWHDNYQELNASDQRGIDVIRTTVKDFARTLPVDELCRSFSHTLSISVDSDIQLVNSKFSDRFNHGIFKTLDNVEILPLFFFFHSKLNQLPGRQCE